MRSNARAVAAELARHELTNLHADSPPRIEDRAIENQPRKATNQKNSYDMRTIIKFTEELARSTPEVRQELRQELQGAFTQAGIGNPNVPMENRLETLRSLVASGINSNTALAAAMAIDQGHVSKLIRRAEQDGWLQVSATRRKVELIDAPKPEANLVGA